MQFPEDWNVPDAIRVRLGANTTGRQRTLMADGHLVLVLHEVPHHLQRERRGVYFWRHPDGNWDFSGEDTGIAALTRHVTSFSAAEDVLENRYFSAKTAEDYFKVLEEVVPILRTASNLYSVLQSARESVPDEQTLIGLRDTAGDIVRSLEILYADAKNALDYALAKTAEEHTRLGEEAVRSGVRLNVLAAIFFPLTAVTAMFGVNMTHGLESIPIWSTWLFFAFGLGLGIVVRGWVMKGVPKELIDGRPNEPG